MIKDYAIEQIDHGYIVKCRVTTKEKAKDVIVLLNVIDEALTLRRKSGRRKSNNG